MSPDQPYIVLYRTLVEEKFMLGAGAGKLKQRDFEYLATLIEEKSRVKLSVSTLKRLWKENFSAVPHPSTLDALVSILDFKNWLEFRKVYAENISKETVIAPSRGGTRISVFVLSALVVLIIAVFSFLGFKKNSKKELFIPNDVLFTADKTVDFGVPNTVGFRYDVSNLQADSFFIQQSWNPRDKMPIDPEKNYISAIYYTPGFHWARLMINDSIAKFVNVHIKTEGWLPLLKYDLRDRVPVYLAKHMSKKTGVLSVTKGELASAGVETNRDFYLRYYNIRDFENLHSDNFTIETKFRCDSIRNIACPTAELMIICEEDVFFIPLTIKGCVSDLELKMGETYQSGRDHDLSHLGTDIFKWQTLQITNQQRKAEIALNGETAHQIDYQNSFGKIVGLIYTFTGAGSVDFIRVKNEGGDIVYEDTFD